MNHPFKNRGRSVRVLLLALLMPFSPIKAETEAPGENARELLEAALAYKMAPGSYKKISAGAKPGMEISRCEYLTIKPDGTRLSRIESEYRSSHLISRSILIVTQEGGWTLREDNSAIFLPQKELERFIQAPVDKGGDKMRSLTLGRATEDGADYIVITSQLNDADRSGARAVGEKVVKQFWGGAFGAGARKQMSKRVSDNIPAQIEYWLKEPARHLATMRFLTKRGRLITEQRVDYDAYEPIADLPADRFTVPEHYTRFYPSSFWDYVDLLWKHDAEVIWRKPKRGKAEATPPVDGADQGGGSP